MATLGLQTLSGGVVVGGKKNNEDRDRGGRDPGRLSESDKPDGGKFGSKPGGETRSDGTHTIRDLGLPDGPDKDPEANPDW